jgi:PAS domain S-box-containing protein
MPARPHSGSEGSTSTLANESWFRAMANSAPMLMWACDHNKKCNFTNIRWSQFTGQTYETAHGDGWIAYIHTDDRMTFTLDFDQAFSKQIHFSFQFRLRTAGNTYRLISGNANPFYDQKNHFAGFVFSGSDIQEEKEMRDTLETKIARHTEELIKKNLQLLQKNSLIGTVLDSTLSMITVVDRDFRYITFNKQVETYTGVKLVDAEGKNMFEVFPKMVDTPARESIRKALRGELVTFKGSESVLNPGYYFDTFYVPLRMDTGEIEGVIIKVQDVTEQVRAAKLAEQTNLRLEQQNQELLRQRNFIEALFDAIVDVVAVLDTDYCYISINRSALNKYGFKREELIGKNIVEVFPSVVNTAMYSDLKRAMDGEFVYDLGYTSPVLGKHFENYYVPLFDINNRVYAVMIIGHDITEVIEASEKTKKAKAILEAKNQELQRSNEELEQFAYVASHDLQEPIRKIATYSNKLLTHSKDKLSDETRTYLQRIHKSTARMYELINGLLHYSRIARENNHFIRVDLKTVIANVLTDFDHKIKQKRAVVQFEQLPEVEAVAVQMTQLFSNLIGNTLKFAKKEIPPVIQIAASLLNDEQKNFYKLNRKISYVNIFYLDNGIGFEQAYAEKIFELFQRIHDRNQYEGSGIGLSICRKIVSNHHGLIFAFSEPGKGATFQVILPLSQESFK